MAVISLVFSGTLKLRQGQPCMGGVGAERVQGLEPFALVVGAARRLAVDGDEVVPARPQRRDPALEAAAEQDRIDAIDQVAQPALAGNAMMEIGELPQEDRDDVRPRRRCRRNRRRRRWSRRSPAARPLRADTQCATASRLSLSSEKCRKSSAKTRTRDLSVEDRVHDGAPVRIRAPTESRSPRQHKITPIRPLT